MLGFLVGSLMGIIVLASAMQSYFEASYRSLDLQIIGQTRERAKSVLDLMTFDLRMMGAGMPMGQSNFQIAGTGMGTAPHPILATSTASSISFRRNEQGVVTVLSADYTPGASATTFSVISAADIENGDAIYISDVAVGGTGGLRGTVSSKTATSITIASGFVASAATTFKAGSAVERVSTIVYDNIPEGGAIGRDSGAGTVIIAPSTSFTLRYFDATGTELVLPLTDAVIRDNLSAIEVTVGAQSTRKRKDGTYYIAQMRQRVGLRNLYLSR